MKGDGRAQWTTIAYVAAFVAWCAFLGAAQFFGHDARLATAYHSLLRDLVRATIWLPCAGLCLYGLARDVEAWGRLRPVAFWGALPALSMLTLAAGQMEAVPSKDDLWR